MSALGSLLGGITRSLQRIGEATGLSRSSVSSDNPNETINTEQSLALHQPHPQAATFADKLRNLGSNLYAYIFKQPLFKLFIHDPSVPPFNPKLLEKDCKVEPVDILDDKGNVFSKKSLAKPLNGDFGKFAVLTHGVRTTGSNIGKISKLFANNRIATLVGDNAGFGNNSDTVLSEANLIADSVATIKTATKVAGTKPLILLGHSLGTALQINALLEIFQQEAKSGVYQVKPDQLILISPWDRVGHMIRDFVANPDSDLSAALGEQMTKMKAVLQKDPANLEKAAEIVFGKNWDTIVKLYQLLEFNRQRPPEFRIGNISIVHGKQDPFVKIERASNLYKMLKEYSGAHPQEAPSINFVTVADGDHFDMQEPGREDDDSPFPVDAIIELTKIPKNQNSQSEFVSSRALQELKPVNGNNQLTLAS